MTLNIFRKGFNYSQDGPGNRLVYHLQGCNLHCAWCANPEGMAIKGTLMTTPAYLTDSVCPHGAIVQKEVDRERCASCVGQECVGKNRNQGISFSAQVYTVESLVAEARQSIPLYYDGGGVTLSGGEVTVQFKAVRRLLQRLKEEGIHTALETNGAHPKLQELFPFTDYLIMDFKHHDDAKLKAATGADNRLIKRNVVAALENHPQLLIRIPLIAQFNDADADAYAFADFFRPLDTQQARFELLPYHEYGKSKWAQCGLPYQIKNGHISEASLALFLTVFSANQLNLIHT